MSEGRTAYLFDLDGTPVDSVSRHVLACQIALDEVGIELAVWRIHHRPGMSGGLVVNALRRETDRPEAAGFGGRLHPPRRLGPPRPPALATCR